MVYRSQSPTNQSESFYQQNNQEQYYGSNPDLIPIKNCECFHTETSHYCRQTGDHQICFSDSDSEVMTGTSGHQQTYCSTLDSALLLANQRVAAKTKRQSPSQPVAPPQVPVLSASVTPSRYCDNVSLGKSSKRANWPNGYRKTISIFLDVIGRNIEVTSPARDVSYIKQVLIK